jgi:hypothetical protein
VALSRYCGFFRDAGNICMTEEQHDFSRFGQGPEADFLRAEALT